MPLKILGEGVCERCSSSHRGEFPAEICIHVPGPEELNLPPLFVFPRLAICLDCGRVSGFEISNERVTELREHIRSTSRFS